LRQAHALKCPLAAFTGIGLPVKLSELMRLLFSRIFWRHRPFG
jgi:hypothetical protein